MVQSISGGKVYISIVSPKYNLIYKGEADFYLEGKQKNLHKILDKDVDKESVVLCLEKGETAEIDVDFPDNCQPGDYLLKIRVYNENEECYYTVQQWFEAYTAHQVSYRNKPVPVGPHFGLRIIKHLQARMIYLMLFGICLSFLVVCLD